jgi:hypothetical protein
MGKGMDVALAPRRDRHDRCLCLCQREILVRVGGDPLSRGHDVEAQFTPLAPSASW